MAALDVAIARKEASVETGEQGEDESDYRLYYTKSLVDLVYTRYRHDVEIFGYEAEYAQLRAFVRQAQHEMNPNE